MPNTSQIRTRLLIISDTHGHSLFDPQTTPDEAQKYAFRKPLPSADVAIHCGDLTLSSHIKEYQTTFDVMRSIDAPLKLVIPGNHDCSMDVDFWEKDVRAPPRFGHTHGFKYTHMESQSIHGGVTCPRTCSRASSASHARRTRWSSRPGRTACTC